MNLPNVILYAIRPSDVVVPTWCPQRAVAAVESHPLCGSRQKNIKLTLGAKENHPVMNTNQTN